jgi:hypothetical protein
MDDNRSTFDAFSTLFEGYVRNLKGCHSPEQRADLLVGMVVLIKEIDRLIANEYSSLATTARETRVLAQPQSDKPINICARESPPVLRQIVVFRQNGCGK